MSTVPRIFLFTRRLAYNSRSYSNRSSVAANTKTGDYSTWLYMGGAAAVVTAVFYKVQLISLPFTIIIIIIITLNLYSCIADNNVYTICFYRVAIDIY